MSKFNKYARQADEAAKAAFKEYREAEAAYREAQKKVESYPKNFNGVMPQYQAEHARAQADFYEKRDAYTAARNKFTNSKALFADIRKDLEADIEGIYKADPASMDSNTLELMKSGILTGSEYADLLEKAQDAENYTMVRLIGKYARDAAQARGDRFGQNDSEARLLRMVDETSRASDGSVYLDTFDQIVSVYDRCTNNTGLIDKWDGLVGDAVAEF